MLEAQSIAHHFLQCERKRERGREGKISMIRNSFGENTTSLPSH